MGYGSISYKQKPLTRIEQKFDVMEGQYIFTLDHPPVNIISVDVNGLGSTKGIDDDYTISGYVITFNYELESIDKVLVVYDG